MYILPKACPSCGTTMNVKQLQCCECETQVAGSFAFPVLLQLSEDHQAFILNFVKHSGSLKKMAKTLNLSYPTVRNMLDDIIVEIQTLEKKTS